MASKRKADYKDKENWDQQANDRPSRPKEPKKSTLHDGKGNDDDDDNSSDNGSKFSNLIVNMPKELFNANKKNHYSVHEMIGKVCVFFLLLIIY